MSVVFKGCTVNDSIKEANENIEQAIIFTGHHSFLEQQRPISKAPPPRTNRSWLLKSSSIIHRSPVLCHAYPLVNQPWKNKKWEEKGRGVYCASYKRARRSVYEICGPIEINSLVEKCRAVSIGRRLINQSRGRKYRNRKDSKRDLYIYISSLSRVRAFERIPR